MQASIVIPAFNASVTLPLVLDALTRQNVNNFEVIVVDDASTDDTSKFASEYAQKLDLKVLRLDENTGRARARNEGIEKSSGDVILLLDSDMEVIPSYVSSHLNLHCQVSRAVGIGAQKYSPHLANKALARYYASRGAARLKPGDPLPGRYFISGLASFSRSLFDEVGGFNSDFRFYGGEDQELGLRFHKAGANLTYLSEAVGYHHHLRRLEDVVSALEEYGRHGVPLVLAKHPEFARELGLDDLTAPRKFGLSIHQMITSRIIFSPLLKLATLFETTYLPSPLITYLIYRSYRYGFVRYLQVNARNVSP